MMGEAVPDMPSVEKQVIVQPLVRIENLDSHVELFSREFEVAGRVFWPEALVAQSPNIDVYFEPHGAISDTFAAGLQLRAQQIAPSTAESESRSDAVTYELLRFEQVTAGEGETTQQGKWFCFTLVLRLPETLLPKSFSLFLALQHDALPEEQLSGSLTVSNEIVVRREEFTHATQHWFSARIESPLRRAGDCLSYFGYVLFPRDHIAAIRLLDGEREIAEVAVGAATEVASRRLVGLQPDEITAVSLFCRAEELSFGIGIPLYLELRLVDGRGVKILMNRMIHYREPSVPPRMVESMYFDAQQRLCIEGWSIPLAEQPCPRFLLQFGVECYELASTDLPGSYCTRRYREDIEQCFPQYTQSEPWGFRLCFHPQIFDRYCVRPQLLQISAQGDNALELLSLEDQKKLHCLIKQEAQEVTLARGIARRSRAYLQRSSRQTPRKGAHRAATAGERYASNFPSRIIFATHNLSATEGAPRVLFEIVRSIVEKQKREVDIASTQCLVLSGSPGELAEEYAQLGVPVQVVEQLHCAAFSRETYRAAFADAHDLCVEFRPDCIYANTLGAFWALELAQRCAVPAIWAIHESKTIAEVGLEVAPYFAEKIQQQVRSAENICFVAEATRSLFANELQDKRTTVIANGVDLETTTSLNRTWPKAKAREYLAIPEDAVVVSIIGTTTRRKGQDVFLRAMDILRSLLPEKRFCFLVVGARDIPFLRELQEQSQALALESMLRFIPETSEVAPYYRASDVMVMCSREESAPLVSLECFAYQRPLVSTAAFGLAEQLEHEATALVYPIDDAEALAHSVERVVRDAALYQKLVQGGRAVVEERFSLCKSIDRHREFIGQVYQESVYSSKGQ